MKTFTTFFLITIVFTFVSCNQNTKTVPEKLPKKENVTDTIVPKKVVSHESETIKNINLTSKLAEKVNRLAQLEHNYLLKSLEIVQSEETLLLGRLQRILKHKDSLSREIDLASIRSEIHNIRKSFLKGTKSMQPNGNIFPRVTIEEYIFKSQQSAKKAFETFIKAKKSGSLWTYVSKEPSVFFLEKNKIYFVCSGGYYMMNMYEEIVEKIKG
ncbi:hypothetical protein IMCC3317_28690 [Kordia antarctica]|uniref:Uncharacterized protein n=1 Tax=Kordia antarctica TaxID=1218801 RepID=A0A7L4ZLT3_9FLAO|nr:hypothetical protein [Kordia antarctica]QHI37490.1 hypothetical protein IMCC3317_28690 [Kordia antarctica]